MFFFSCRLYVFSFRVYRNLPTVQISSYTMSLILTISLWDRNCNRGETKGQRSCSVSTTMHNEVWVQKLAYGSTMDLTLSLLSLFYNVTFNYWWHWSPAERRVKSKVSALHSKMHTVRASWITVFSSGIATSSDSFAPLLQWRSSLLRGKRINSHILPQIVDLS